MGKHAVGLLKRKLKSGDGVNEKEIPRGVDFEPISYEWMFMVSGGNTENRAGYR